MNQVILAITPQRMYDLSSALGDSYDKDAVPAFDFYRFGLIDVLCRGLAGFPADRDISRAYSVVESNDHFQIHLPFSGGELDRIQEASQVDLREFAPNGVGAVLQMALSRLQIPQVPSLGPDEMEIIIKDQQAMSFDPRYACYMVVEVRDEETGMWMPCAPHPYFLAT